MPEQVTKTPHPPHAVHSTYRIPDIDQISISGLPEVPHYDDPSPAAQISKMEATLTKALRQMDHLQSEKRSQVIPHCDGAPSDSNRGLLSDHAVSRKDTSMVNRKPRRTRSPSSDSSDDDSCATRSSHSHRTSRATHLAAMRSLPKTLVYNGRSNWQAFQLKFSRFAEVSEWTADECRDCLLQCLTDKALQYGAMLLKRQPSLPYRKLLQSLERRFGVEELPAAAQAKFNQTFQEKSESLEEWADRVQTIATEAFRQLPESYSNQQVIARFCQGLHDTEAGHSVFMKSFSTLDEAMNEVRLFQHSKQAMGMRRRSNRMATAANYDEPEVQVSAVQERVKPMPSSVESMLAQLQLELREVKDQLRHTPKSSRGGGLGANRGRGAGGVGRSRSKNCWICNAEGHFHRDCPNKQPLNQKGLDKGATTQP